MTFYWEVKKAAMDAALCEESTQQRSTCDDTQDDSSDSDLDDAPSMRVIPLEHILQGSYKDRSASELYPSHTTMMNSSLPSRQVTLKFACPGQVLVNSFSYLVGKQLALALAYQSSENKKLVAR